MDTATTYQLDLTELTKIRFFKKDAVNLLNYGKCSICLRKVHLLHLSSHKALVHCKDHYLADIQEKQDSSQVTPDRCPESGCQFAVKSETGPDVLAARDILLIKHYQTHFSVLDISKKYNLDFNGGLRANVKTEDVSSSQDVKPEPCEGRQVDENTKQCAKKRKHSEDEVANDGTYTYDENDDVDNKNFLLSSFVKSEEAFIESTMERSEMSYEEQSEDTTFISV
jgi:hypothetical protein